jgi:methionine sulfoxide reductase heme-binding subunit
MAAPGQVPLKRRTSQRFGGLIGLAPHLAAGVLLAWVAFDYFSGGMGINPLQALTQRTGKLALIFLVLSLAISPLNFVFGLRQLVPARRTLGLYAFLFASLHFFTFAGLDYQFNWTFLQVEFVEKPYIWVGLSALLTLLVLALTSFRFWMKRLGKNWKRLHRLVYPAALLAVVHYAWAAKGEVLRLQGDILQPLFFGLLVLALLGLRLAWVKQRLPVRQNQPAGRSD